MKNEMIDKGIRQALKELLTLWFEWGRVNPYPAARAKGLYAKKDIYNAMEGQEETTPPTEH